ncbi:MAG TPA: dTMP kinase [Chloroflexota bacterium]|nr:dTMP kinase [Chloroflexota bacterium]
MSAARGRFITFEGPEGSGKSTQVALLRARLEKAGRQVRQTREPGGTPLGEALRRILLTADGTGMVPLAEALLLSTDRAQHVAEVIRPALAAGCVVIGDRYVDSMLAYQGFGRELPLDVLDTLARVATESLVPDLTILIDLDVEESLSRRRRASETGGGELNRFDVRAMQFHERVRHGFLALAEREPDRFCVLDGARPVEDVAEDIWERVKSLLGPIRRARPRAAGQLALPV